MSLISTENFKKSLTQQNGERTKKAVFRWKKLLENTKDFGTIRTKAAKESTAMLLENQYRYLKEAATNTSIFGPQNGLTGGALNVGDNYATGDNRLPRILIPMVRRIYPALMSNEVVGVQPMPGPVALGFALRYKYLKGALHHGDSDTKHIHHKDVATTTQHITDVQNETEYPARGIKGIEIGDGFEVVEKSGSENNDPMDANGFLSNHAGGILGGISNGSTVTFRLAVKPTPSIAAVQKSINIHGKEVDVEISGRHDPCLVPRIVPVVESMAAIVVADLLLRNRAAKK